MGIVQTDHKGFSTIEALLLIVIVAMLGFTGWYVLRAKQNADNNLNSNHSTTPVIPKKNTTKSNTIQSSSSVADWTSYTSASGKFSLKYPKTWVTAANPQLCNNDIFLLGANSSSVGTCASENFGQMTITWRSDRLECGDLNSSSWTQNSKDTVTVAGVNATKISATAKSQGEGAGSYSEGTQTVQYCFIANGTTYIADYTQIATYPNVLADFNTMVTQTFKLN